VEPPPLTLGEIETRARAELDPAIAAAGVRPVELDTMLASSDVVSLHAPLIPQTLHLLDRGRLETMSERKRRLRVDDE
jgi:phosphoglycerate dehydrogenase-like enzyme